MQKRTPLYVQVMDGLKNRIESGDFAYDIPFATEERLTKEYGVSRITAIRALEELEHAGIIYRKRGSGSFVSRGALKILNGNKDTVTVKLEKKNPGISLVALVMPFDIKKGNMFKCFDGINSVLNKENCFVSIYNANELIENEELILRRLLDQGIDGVICYPVRGGRNFEVYNQFLVKQIPLVLIDNYIESMPISYVVSDNFNGSKMLCEYAVSQGHKKIGYICRGRVDLSAALRNRYMGYTAALSEYGIDVDLDHVHLDLNAKFDMLSDSEAVKYKNKLGYVAEMVRRMYNDGVTAIMCQNDWVALEVYNICKEQGISVPDEMCIFGFDNLDELAELEGGSTLITAEQDFYEIGRRAGETVLKEISGENRGSYKNIVPVKLIDRRKNKDSAAEKE